MLSIGLTGGIGSGKSTVARIFEVLGIPVYYADKRAKWLMQNDPKLINELIKNFGEQTYKNGQLNRSYLSGLVFNNPDNLKKLNGIVHPFTISDGRAWMLNQKSAYAIKEAALIFESGIHGDFDFIISVQAPKSLRIKRTINRDQITRDAVIARMNNQLDPDIVKRLSDFVIDNDEINLLIPQVLQIHHELMEKAKSY
jgi:dephospho-CoA kinase